MTKYQKSMYFPYQRLARRDIDGSLFKWEHHETLASSYYAEIWEEHEEVKYWDRTVTIRRFCYCLECNTLRRKNTWRRGW